MGDFVWVCVWGLCSCACFTQNASVSLVAPFADAAICLVNSSSAARERATHSATAIAIVVRHFLTFLFC